MTLTDRINKIAADFRIFGGYVPLSLVACVLIDENNEVVITGRDLAASIKKLNDSVGAIELTQASLMQARCWISGQFGVRFQSTGTPDIAQTRKLVETTDASPTNPCLVRFEQIILTSFTGPGQFDLVERDATDVDVFADDGNGGFTKVSGGASEVTLATKTGFTDGATTGAWSRFSKVVTSNKAYMVKFIPGTTGDGVYSVRMSGLK